jgi:hypothetical protein
LHSDKNILGNIFKSTWINYQVKNLRENAFLMFSVQMLPIVHNMTLDRKQ